jgi:hypothetical protein
MAQFTTRVAAITAAAFAASLSPIAAGTAEDSASAVFGVRLPPDYRDWKVISVAREAGNTNDIRVILGNDVAVGAFRDGTRPFPDGTMIARLAWQYVSSPDNDAIFGQAQSFVAGPATNVQISVRDSTRFAATGGWGFGQFEGGRPNQDEALLNTCSPCHSRAPRANDQVFTRYAP